MVSGYSKYEEHVNDEGQLHTVMRGKADEGNSTIIPLLANNAFTGDSIDTFDYSAISIVVHSDVESATNGLSIEYSVNGTDWHPGESYTILAGATKFFTPTLQGQYARVIYTNGTSDQTDFHMHTILRKSPIKWSSHNITDPIKDEDDAELIKAVITGKKADGTYDNVSLTNGSNMKVSFEEFETSFYSEPLPVADFYLNVSKGLVPGHTIINKFGQNSSLNSSTYEDIWDVGGTYTYPADGTAPIVEIGSDEGADTEPIEIQGLDINGDLVVQTKTLTGTTHVTLDTALWRVFRMKNVGTSDIVGQVHATGASGAGIYAQIDNGNNQTLMALFTIPNGKTGYLIQGTNNLSGVTRAVAASGRLMMRPYGQVFQLKKTFGVNSEGSSFIRVPSPLPGKISAKTDIKVSAIGSANGVSINTTFDILLVDD